MRVNGICRAQYFDKNVRKAVSFIKEHANEYGAIPTLEQIKATTGTELDDVKEIDARHKDMVYRRI